MMTGFERYSKKTRRALFLEEMEKVVPWAKLCALIEPHYPKAGNGRPPVGVERMLRIYFLQQWFNLSDTAVVTPAHVADATVLPELLHGEESRVWGDQGYVGQRDVIHQCAPQAQDCTHRRYRYKDHVDEVERAKNRTKSKVRSKAEHVFGVLKLKFGFVKVRYRGLAKNANRLFATCALVNLFMVRKKLLSLAAA